MLVSATILLIGCDCQRPSVAPSPTNGQTTSTPVVSKTSPVANPMAEPRSRVAHTAAVCDGIVYFFGGITEDQHEPPPTNVECFDIRAGRWTRRSALPTHRNFAAAAELGGMIYLVGGLDAEAVAMGLVERYDPAADTWTTVAPLAVPRSRLAVAVLNGRLYAVGGLEGAERVRCADSRVIEAYDPATNTWMRLPDMPTARHALAAVGHKGRLYALGGYTIQGSGQTTTVESFDPVPGVWSAAPSMRSARGFFAAFSLGDDLLAIGNLKAPVAPERLTLPATGARAPSVWLACAAPDLRRFRFAAILYEGSVFAFGGEGEATPYTRIYDPAQDRWLR